MRLVDLSKDVASIDPIYVGIEQPMPIYYSAEEVMMNETNPIIKSTQALYYKLVHDLATTEKYPSHKPVYMKTNLFISTGEKFMMKDLSAEDGLRIEFSDKPVENNYIRCYAIVNRMNSVFHLFTSSGVWAVGNKGFTVTGAIAPTYRNEAMWNKEMRRQGVKNVADKRMKKLMTGKSPTAEDYKFTGLFLNEKSPTYLNLFASAHMAYSSTRNPVNMKEVNEILNSERVRKIITQQMRIFMPGLVDAMRKQSDPKKMAQFLHKIAEDTVNSGTASVDDKLKATQAIINVAYRDEGLILDYGSPGVNMIAQGSGNQNLISESYNDEDLKKIKGGNEVENKSTSTMSDEDFELLSEEVDIIPGTYEEKRPKPEDN